MAGALPFVNAGVSLISAQGANAAKSDAAKQAGLAKVEQFGVFGEYNSMAQAAEAQAVFQNQSPGSLAALSVDELSAATIGLPTAFINSYISPSVGAGAGILRGIPPIAWVVLGVVIFMYFFRGKH